MGKRKKRTSDKVVCHPRYGGASIPSAFNATDKMVRDSFWGYKDADIFIESAIPADTSRQNCATFPRGYYVDVLKLCRDCKRKFIFFAREQKHWFEELGFYVDADCVRCTECRVSEKELKRVLQRYSNAIGVENPSNEMLEALTSDMVVLWNKGLIQNVNTLRRIRNLANKAIPACDATEAINLLVLELAAGAE